MLFGNTSTGHFIAERETKVDNFANENIAPARPTFEMLGTDGDHIFYNINMECWNKNMYEPNTWGFWLLSFKLMCTQYGLGYHTAILHTVLPVQFGGFPDHFPVIIQDSSRRPSASS